MKRTTTAQGTILRLIAMGLLVVGLTLGLLYDRVRPMNCNEAINHYGREQLKLMPEWNICP